jgi:3-deoxy-7-phosphoheptulonate synthase
MDNLVNQVIEGNRSIVAVMIESHLGWGAQKLTEDLSQLEYGVSITDGCIDWETTERVLRDAATRLAQPLVARAG